VFLKRDTEPEPAVRANNEFALDLYGKLRREPGNLVFSPYSISTALAMTYGGARGETEAQIARTLRFSAAPAKLHKSFAALQAVIDAVQARRKVQLMVANGLWPQERYAFLEEYLSLLKEFYGAAITPLDYQGAAEVARHTINAWIESKTGEKIRDLIPPGVLNDLTRLVLVNAIYFKGDWEHQFDPSLTTDLPFWLSPKEKVEVPMMAQTEELLYAEPRGLQVLALPYVGWELSMVVLLPSSKRGLKQLERSLTATKLSKWTDDLEPREVRVFLPRFLLRYGCELSAALKALGMTDAFDGDVADFSGMDGRERWLFLSAAIHQAFIDVKEEGTEAAAATGMVFLAAGLPDELPATFIADHPFLFFIRENRTGSILFLGRVVNPALAAD
jgi:serpin B